MRHCNKCGKTKPLQKFHKTGRGEQRRGTCSECRRDYLQSLRARPAVKQVTHKVCNTCGQSKPAGDFCKDARASDKLNCRCAPCSKTYADQYRISRRGRQVRRRCSEAAGQRRRAIPHMRIGHAVSCAIRESLVSQGGSKQGRSCWKFLGYTKQELREHLENLFLPGMTWDNYGRMWHIDHIVPQSRFVYTSMQDYQFQMCWSLNNLQPLWSTDNLRKGARSMAEFTQWIERGR